MALEGTINSISNANSKRIVQVVAIPSSFCLPGDRPGDEPLYWSDDYVSDREGEVVLGISYRGQIKIDLNDSPHVLSAGETGSGKSVILRCCLWQLIQQGARVIMIDFKGGVEFGIDYEQYGEVITDRKRAAEVLKDVVEEMKHRLEELRQARVKNFRNIIEYLIKSFVGSQYSVMRLEKCLIRRESQRKKKFFMRNWNLT